MANEYYITAGLPAIDSADYPPSGENKCFITAGLVADDRPAAGGASIPVLMHHYQHNLGR